MGSDPLSLEGLTLFITQNSETCADALLLDDVFRQDLEDTYRYPCSSCLARWTVFLPAVFFSLSWRCSAHVRVCEPQVFHSSLP